MPTDAARSWPAAPIGPMRQDCRLARELGPYTVAIDSRILATYQVVRFAIFKVLRLCTRIQIRRVPSDSSGVNS